MKSFLVALASTACCASALADEVEVFTGQPVLADEPYLLANWNFNEGGADDPDGLLAVSRGTGALQHSFVPANVLSYGGSSVNGFDGDASGGSLSLQVGSDTANNGAALTFVIATTHFRDIVLTYVTQGTGTGFESQTWSYSTDGKDFIDTGIVVEPPGSYGLGTVDLSAVGAIEDEEEVFLRAVFEGGTSANGNNRVDNVQVRATADVSTAVPVTAALLNADAQSPLSGTELFASGSEQSVAIEFEGTEATQIESFSLELPADWSGLSLDNVILSGAGFETADASVSANNVTISNADVSQSSPGTVILENVMTPSGQDAADWGRFSLGVEAAEAGQSFEELAGPLNGRLAISISQVRQVDEQDVPLAIGERVAVTGVATVGSGVFHPATGGRFSTFLQDKTGGVALDHPSIDDFWGRAVEGNRYTAIGTVSQFAGLTQIALPGEEGLIDHGTDAVPEPAEVTIEDLLNEAEKFEGSLIRLARVFKTGGEWPEAGESAEVTISAAGGPGSMVLYVNRYTDISFFSEPAWPADVVGIFSQHETTSHPSDGYHIVPRAYSDFLPPSPAGDGSGAASLVNITSGSSFEGRALFDSDARQSVSLSVAGDDATLESVSIALPEGWSGLSIQNVNLSGPGFAAAKAAVSGDTLTVANASLTAEAAGTVDIADLTTPDGEEVVDFGIVQFTVKTALSGGELAEIAVQPQGNLPIPIAQVREVDEQGVALSRYRRVVISGVATIASGVLSESRLNVYLQDETGGVALDHSPLSDFSVDAVTAGNRYLAVGTVDQYRGLTQIDPGEPENLVDLGPEEMPEPQSVTIAQLLAEAESLEGGLVRIARVSKASLEEEWPGAGSSVNLTLEDPSDSSLTLRIVGSTGIGENAEPDWPLDVVGIVGQFSGTTPAWVSGYQLFPRAYDDFLPASEMDGFVQWREEFFPGADPSLSDPAADPDGDGVRNLLEYAFGGDPHENSRHLLPGTELAGDFLQIVFHRAKEATDAVFRVEGSSDLAEWTEVWSSESNPYDSDEAVSQQVVSDVVSFDTFPRRFLRLRVTRK